MSYKYVFAVLLFQLQLGKVAIAATDSLQLSYDSLVQNVGDRQFDYHTLSLHAKMVWDDGTSQQEFQASIRMLKDSMIWMSITAAMGIEAARILITPDTFCIINKIQGTYELHNFGFAQTWLLFPVSFQMLQEVIAGQKIDIQQRAGMATMDDSNCILYAESEKMLEKIWVNNGNYTLAKILLKDKLIAQDMTVTFDDYKEQPAEPGKPFAFKRTINVNRSGIVLNLSIETTKIKLDEALAYPFEISSKYKRQGK